MPRKSPRTATKTYRRKQLMWDEASDVNHIHDDSLIFPSTASVAKKSNDSCLVTPSPIPFPLSDTVKENEMSQNKVLARKQLFSKNEKTKSRSSVAASKGSVAKRKFRKHHRKNFASGDSLATIIALEKTHSSKGLHAIKSKRNYRETTKRQTIATTAAEKVSNKNIQKKSEQNEDDARKRKPVVTEVRKKKKNLLPYDFISLLASPAKKHTTMARVRSAKEILDCYNQDMKALRSKKGLRVSLPRACKNDRKHSFREPVTDEDTDEEESNNDNGNKLSTNNSMQMNDLFRDEESREISTTNVHSSTNKFSSQPVSPSVNHDSEYKGLGLVPRKERNLKSCNRNSFDRTEQHYLSPKNSRSKNKLIVPMLSTLGKNPITSRRMRKDSQGDNQLKISELNSSEQLPGCSKQKAKVCNKKESGRLPSNTGGGGQVLHHRDNFLNKPSKKSYHHRNQRSKQFSMEEYSLYSNYSNKAKLNEGSRMHKSTSVKNNSVVSPQRAKEKWQRVEQGIATSKKRVRFDSTTTTFSVKIKIKTNLDAGKQNNSRGDSNQSVTLSPTLNESTVQAIANQVTQACLTQAATSAGSGNSEIVRSGGNRGININADMSEEGESSSHTTESSSNSNQSSDAEDEPKNGKSKFSNDTFEERHTPIVDARRINSYRPRKGFDDVRSVTSELTSDWSKPRSHEVNDTEYLEKKSNAALIKDHSDHNNSKWKEILHDPNNVDDTGSTNVRSCSSISRRQRIWSCSDSLAGSHFGSVASAVKKGKIPREVSLRKLSRRDTRSRSSPDKLKKRKNSSKIVGVGDNRRERNSSERSKGTDAENTSQPLIASSTSKRSRVVQLSPSYRCGKCEGCQRIFDCQTCDVCLEKLNLYSSSVSPSMDGGRSFCLARRCRRTHRIGFADSLLGLQSSTKEHKSSQLSDDKKEQCDVQTIDKTSSYRTKKNGAKNLQDSRSKNAKAPWDDGGDWTVDYSYLSEPEYRQNWEKITHSTSRKKDTSSTKYQTPSWWLPNDEKQTNKSVGGRGRTSLSSVSESIMSQKRSKRITNAFPMLSNRSVKGGRKGGKRKRDPLHGLVLPGTSTDACSVTSWRENRKCLRALMEYDEADQDWV